MEEEKMKIEQDGAEQGAERSENADGAEQGAEHSENVEMAERSECALRVDEGKAEERVGGGLVRDCEILKRIRPCVWD